MLELDTTSDMRLGVAMTWQDPYRQPGWQDPYAQYGPDAYPPAGPDPYGQYAQGAPPGQDPYAPYGYYGPQAVQPGSTGLTVGALIANIVSAILTCGIGLTWLPGVILSAVALGRARSDPTFARRLTLWAWVCFTLDIVVTIAIIVTFAVFAGDPGTPAP